MTHGGEPDRKWSREEGLQGFICLFVCFCFMRLELRKKQKMDGGG